MKRILIVAFVMLPIAMSAQWGITPNQAMVKQSIEPSLVVVCSAYKLQDSAEQRYGRNNRAEFGQGYTLGVVSDSGLILAASALQPWMLDADFARYRQSYTPVLSALTYRQTSDSAYSPIPLTTDSTMSSGLLRIPTDSIRDLPALAIHTDSTHKNGWLLWVCVSDTLGKAAVSSTTAIMYSAELAGADTVLHVDAPMAPSIARDRGAARKPVGAVWVVPSYPHAGIVQFRVAGMAVRDSTGWIIAPIYVNKQIHIKSTDDSSDELTPSPDPQQPQENKKNKKNK